MLDIQTSGTSELDPLSCSMAGSGANILITYIHGTKISQSDEVCKCYAQRLVSGKKVFIL